MVALAAEAPAALGATSIRTLTGQCCRSAWLRSQSTTAQPPAHHLATITTDHLVADIERLREHLAVDRWVVAGILAR